MCPLLIQSMFRALHALSDALSQILHAEANQLNPSPRMCATPHTVEFPPPLPFLLRCACVAAVAHILTKLVSEAEDTNLPMKANGLVLQ